MAEVACTAIDGHSRQLGPARLFQVKDLARVEEPAESSDQALAHPASTLGVYEHQQRALENRFVSSSGQSHRRADDEFGVRLAGLGVLQRKKRRGGRC